MARRNAFRQKVRRLLVKGLKERLPNNRSFSVHIESKGYKDHVRVIVISDYFKRKDFFERIDFISNLLEEEGLTPYELLKATKIGFTEKEADELGL